MVNRAEEYWQANIRLVIGCIVVWGYCLIRIWHFTGRIFQSIPAWWI